ncbi:MAG: hypothetical protein K2K89_10420, partial [Ruminococcus sp.]|nr:hypothetical protein [Ruminococcus sp.]
MKKFIVLLCLTATLTSCGSFSLMSNNNFGSNKNSSKEQSVQNNESASTPAYIVIPSDAEYVEMKSSIENGSVLCRLYTNDEVIFNRSEQQWANISANGFTGYVELSNISFSAVEISAETEPIKQAETQAQVQAQAPAETQAVPVQAIDNGSQGINIENKIENTITIEFSLDDFQVKYATPMSYPKYTE